METFTELGGTRAFLDPPSGTVRDGVALTHGAGSDCDSALLRSLSESLVQNGFLVLRYDLSFRRDRRAGPPRPGDAERDREGIRTAIEAVRRLVPGRVVAGGHSYGGRQTTMLAAESPQIADILLLLSYPLHPPRKPEDLRTGHFERLRIRSLFIHGSRDPFGSPDEMKSALKAIPASDLMVIDGAGHDLTRPAGIPARISSRLTEMLTTHSGYSPMTGAST